MRKLVVLLVVSLLPLICFSTNAFALPVTGDWVKVGVGDNRVGSGGEFVLTQQKVDDPYSYISFCVEYNEYISIGATYTVSSVGDTAYGGGFDSADDGDGDKISDASQYVMSLWTNNYDKLAKLLGWNEKSGAYAQLVQEAIWYFEDERTLRDYGFGYKNAVIDLLKTDSQFYVSGKWISTDYLNDLVVVVNLVTYDRWGHVINQQSQLVAETDTAPVPEPATMLLLGTGLIGLAGVSRKSFKK